MVFKEVSVTFGMGTLCILYRVCPVFIQIYIIDCYGSWNKTLALHASGITDHSTEANNIES